MVLMFVRAVLGYSALLLAVAALLMGCGDGEAPRPDDNPASVQLGLLTDTHYAENCRSTVTKCDKTLGYAQAVLKKMKDEGAAWVAHVGDNKDESALESIRSNQELAHAAALGYAVTMEAALQATYPEKVVHVLGNHDMDRLTKGEFLDVIKEGSGHYTRDLGGGVSAVVIDSTYDAQGRNFSTMSCQDPGNGCALGFGEWRYAHVPGWQLEWLRKTLEAEKAAKRRVLLFSHIRLDGDRDLEESAWVGWRIVVNAAEVRAVLEDFKSTVLVVFHGHDHRAEDSPRIVNGIGYYTLIAIVEAMEVEKAPWATVRVWPEACRVQIVGHGEVPVSGCDGADWCINRTIVPFSADWKEGALGDAECEGLVTRTELV